MRLCLVALLVVFALGSPAVSASPSEAATNALHALFEEAWEFGLREEPMFASSVGDTRYDDRLASLKPEDFVRRGEFLKATQAKLQAIDRGALAASDQVSYDIFAGKLVEDSTELEFKAERMVVTAEGGFHSGFTRLPAETSFLSTKDYDNYLARLAAFPAYMDQNIALMRAGLAEGFTPPRVVFKGFESTIAPHVVDDVTKSVFYVPFTKFPMAVGEADRSRLVAEGRKVIAAAIVPAYRRFLEFMTREYIPGSRTTIGASEWPRGRDYYAFLVRRFTTLEISPEEIHEIGKREVARIRTEMDRVIAEVGFKGSFAEFLQFLRTDPRFYAKTPDQLLKEAAFIAKKMDGKLPTLFRRLPRQPYGVEPVPTDIAPKYTAGRYVGAPLDSTRGGTYWVNTYALESRTLYTLEALSLHEAVPGHHMQISLQKELSDLPKFRQHSYFNAYGEGWGLYSEWLGLEAGFYTDPYSNFGRLTYEMWRACRLVVDTGLHAFGWSRQQALDYMGGYTALSLHEVETEIDRYISWPGQALSYKMGELKIRELRALAEKELGPKFDIRDFHDTVLLNGSLPLTVLETQVRDWIERTR